MHTFKKIGNKPKIAADWDHMTAIFFRVARPMKNELISNVANSSSEEY